MVLKRVGPMSMAKVSGTLYIVIGLFIGAIFSSISILGLATATQDGPGRLGMMFGAGAILWAPIFYGLLGFVGGLIMAALYNVMAKLVGGVQLELE